MIKALRHSSVPFRVATLNVRGISSTARQESLRRGLLSYKIDICCLQETKLVRELDECRDGYRLICFPPECRHYGLGFAVSSSLTASIQRFWQVSDRVAVLTLKLFENSSGSARGRGSLAIINVYAPASSRCAQSAEELDKFYSALSQAYDQVKQSGVLYIAGDFNAKAGSRIAGETAVGSHGRGKRNVHGQTLVDFCECNNLYLANTSFQHPARHITTWTGWRKDYSKGKTVPVYNQIDYIICPRSQKRLLRNSRSYGGIEITTDHRLVVAEIDFTRIYGVMSAAQSGGSGGGAPTAKLNTRKLLEDSKFLHRLCPQCIVKSHVKKRIAISSAQLERWPAMSWDMRHGYREDVYMIRR